MKEILETLRTNILDNDLLRIKKFPMNSLVKGHFGSIYQFMDDKKVTSLRFSDSLYGKIVSQTYDPIKNQTTLSIITHMDNPKYLRDKFTYLFNELIGPSAGLTTQQIRHDSDSRTISVGTYYIYYKYFHIYEGLFILPISSMIDILSDFTLMTKRFKETLKLISKEDLLEQIRSQNTDTTDFKFDNRFL